MVGLSITSFVVSLDATILVTALPVSFGDRHCTGTQFADARLTGNIANAQRFGRRDLLDRDILPSYFGDCAASSGSKFELLWPPAAPSCIRRDLYHWDYFLCRCT